MPARMSPPGQGTPDPTRVVGGMRAVCVVCGAVRGVCFVREVCFVRGVRTKAPANDAGTTPCGRERLLYPVTTSRSRGASLRTIGPSSPHTMMSSIRAPYRPSR